VGFVFQRFGTLQLRGRDATVEAFAVERLPQALPTKRLKNVHYASTLAAVRRSSDLPAVRTGSECRLSFEALNL
jgi:hypothetical protein